jgi:formyl-CoA transferase
VQHLGIAAPVESPLFGNTRMVASAVTFEGLPRAIRYPTPEAGTHTDEVLAWLGYSPEELERLGAAGVTRPLAARKENVA